MEPKPQQKVLVAGGSGFIGRAIVDRLLEGGREVVVLSRNPAGKLKAATGALTMITASALERSSLDGVMHECDALVNAIGIIRERRLRGITYERVHLEVVGNLLDEAAHSGIDRFIQISALGARSDGVSRYQTSKRAAEEEIMRRMRRWTIFRPSPVIGPGAGFVTAIRPLARLPVAPVFGDGRYSFQPVDLRVVAEAVVKALDDDRTCGRLYELRGPRTYTFDEILDEMGRALGKRRVRKLHLPLWLVRPMVAATAWLPFSPVTSDQLEMLLDGVPGTGRDGVSELGLPVIDLPEALQHALGRTNQD